MRFSAEGRPEADISRSCRATLLVGQNPDNHRERGNTHFFQCVIAWRRHSERFRSFAIRLRLPIYPVAFAPSACNAQEAPDLRLSFSLSGSSHRESWKILLATEAACFSNTQLADEGGIRKVMPSVRPHFSKELSWRVVVLVNKMPSRRTLNALSL